MGEKNQSWQYGTSSDEMNWINRMEWIKWMEIDRYRWMEIDRYRWMEIDRRMDGWWLGGIVV